LGNLINSKDLSIMIPGEKFYRARDIWAGIIGSKSKKRVGQGRKHGQVDAAGVG
jgi:hypothetical protein